MIWFTHQGKVTFVVYADYDCWKDPGDEFTLEMLKKSDRRWKDEEDELLNQIMIL